MLLRKIDFKNMKNPPEGYLPGISWGDAGFITTIENGKTL